MYEWKSLTVKSFIDDLNTKFFRGPFETEVPGIGKMTYDWQLTDKNGVDYCNEDQMVLWDVKMKKKLS